MCRCSARQMRYLWERGLRDSQCCGFHVVSVLVVPTGTHAHSRAPVPFDLPCNPSHPFPPCSPG